MGQRESTRVRTAELLRLGHRSLAIFAGLNPGLDIAKRRGVLDAVKAAGLDPASVREYPALGSDGTIFGGAGAVLDAQPRPTAVLAFDDSLACMLSFRARRHLNLRVPGDLSIASFHDWPWLAQIEPALSSVHFEFFDAGRRAAEALNHAALTGEPMTDICFEPAYIPGATVGPVPTP